MKQKLRSKAEPSSVSTSTSTRSDESVLKETSADDDDGIGLLAALAAQAGQQRNATDGEEANLRPSSILSAVDTGGESSRLDQENVIATSSGYDIAAQLTSEALVIYFESCRSNRTRNQRQSADLPIKTEEASEEPSPMGSPTRLRRSTRR